ncbi:MAG: DUF2971 domain-containing protein [Saprospiraceae bacterium]|nr:DUF2971 domain-containing protein [Saprospiraceae bacterium]
MEKRINTILSKMVEQKQIPQFAYKLRTINRYLFDILVNSEMWFAKPDSFNDPFDCAINLDMSGSSQEEINVYYDKFLKSKLNEKERLILNPKMITKEKFEELLNKSAKNVIINKGIGCFLDNKEELLMWAHYADSHRGIALKFDVLKDDDFFYPSRRVVYTQEYPKYNYLKGKNEVAEKLIFTKSKEWKYEGEIRIIKPKSGQYKFNPESLVEITFGCKTSKEDEKTILEIARLKYPHIKIFNAIQNQRNFKLDFKENINWL